MIIGYEDLKMAVGGSTRQQVTSNLKQMHIKYILRPDGKPISTIDAFNDAMKIKRKSFKINNEEEFEQGVEL